MTPFPFILLRVEKYFFSVRRKGSFLLCGNIFLDFFKERTCFFEKMVYCIMFPGLPERHYANVAQLVEQLIRNEQVIGSNPFIGSI